MAEFNLADVITEEDTLPRISRGRSSQDYDFLIERMAGGKIHSIPGVSEADRAKVSQKVRGAAAKAGFKVTVRYSKADEKVYFQKTGNVEGGAAEQAEESVAANGKAKGK